MASSYLTISDELLPLAELAERHFHDHGYRLWIERKETHFPYTPAFVAKRAPTTVIVELDSGLFVGRLMQWVRYCRSCDRDTRIAVCLSSESGINEQDLTILREAGVGVYRDADGAFREMIVPQDLAFQLELPELGELSQKVRRLLGPVYEKMARGDWREGFEEACQTLEAEAREHIKLRININKVQVLKPNGQPQNITNEQIDRYTLGQLGDAFKRIQNQNYVDGLLARALPDLNPDRIGIVHKRRTRAVEGRLRRKVGRHMWTIINTLSQMT